MESTTTEREILGLEREYWRAMEENDVETAVSLTYFPCIVTSPHGAMRVTETEYRRLMKANETRHLREIELADPQVEVVNERTAIIAYSLDVNGTKMIDSSTWVKSDGKWLCVFHTETPEMKEDRGRKH